MAKPRLSIELEDEDTAIYLTNNLSWGAKKRLFNAIADDVVRMLKLHGEFFVAAVCSKDIGFQEWYKGAKK